MELEILRKLKEKADELDAELSRWGSNDVTYLDAAARKSLDRFERYVAGFCAAVDMIEEIVNDNFDKMACDYAEDAHVDEGQEG